jgi:flagellar L-ring protein precursor FlgH
MNRHAFLAALAALPLAACGADGHAPGFTAALPLPPATAHAPQNGAIFQASSGYAAYHEGTRARRVGDLVTIVLVENLVTSKATNGRTDRQGSASIIPPTAGPLDFLNPDALKAAAQGSFNGRGDAGQRSALSGAVAVTIAEVRPNGTALVTGEKQMLLSQGEEWVQFAGIIRLSDIDVDNRLPSSAVADARIIYSGAGAVQQASRPGWLSRFFGQISPF